HTERLQRVAHLRGDRLGPRECVRPRLAQLRPVRRALRVRRPAERRGGAAAQGVDRAQGPFPAGQPARLQPEVLPALGTPLRRLRTAARPAAGRPRRARRRGLPAVSERAAMTGLALVLALGSALALNWGWLEQHGAARRLPELALQRPLASLKALFRDRSWVVGFSVGIGGWALYVAALTLAPLSLVQGTSAGGIAVLAA